MKSVMMLSILGATHAFAPGKLPECLSQSKLAVNRPSHARRNIASSPLTSHAYPSLILSLRMSDDSTGMWSQKLRPLEPYLFDVAYMGPSGLIVIFACTVMLTCLAV